MELEFIKSKSGPWVPVLNGTLLHSSFDPEREARDLVERGWARLEPVKSVVVFGLGGAFHVRELLARKNFNIVVVESDRTLAEAVLEKDPALGGAVTILAEVPPARLCGESAMVTALSHSYAILKHPASVRSSFYYAAVSAMLNERTIARLRQLSEGRVNLSRFFDSLNISGDQFLTLPMVEEAMARRGTGLDKEGLIWMTLRELVL